MIEIHSIRILNDTPGIHERYLFEARFIDESKGYKDTELGPMIKWDKSLNISSNTIRAGVERLELRLSEIFGSEDV